MSLYFRERRIERIKPRGVLHFVSLVCTYIVHGLQSIDSFFIFIFIRISLMAELVAGIAGFLCWGLGPMR